jgi:tetratricopeptide (TPR) repeat protein
MKLHGIVVVLPSGVLLIAGIVFAQAPGTPTNFTQTLDRALQLAHTHRYAEAQAAIKGLPPPPNHEQRIAFYRLKAAIASGLGHSGAAAQNMEVASRLAPENMDLRLAAGIARLQAQVDTHINPAATLAGLRSAVLPPEREIEIRLRLAEILSQAGLYAEAATDFEVACRLAPARSDLFFDLALARFRIGQLDAALASAEQAKALDESGSVESLIGDIQEKRGDSLAAVHSYQAAVTLEPAEERHRLALGLELLRHQTFDAALVVLNQAATLFPQSVRVKILLSLTYYFVDRSPDAARTLLEATQLDPNDETAARYLGEITLQDTADPDPAAVAQVCKFADKEPQSWSANVFCGGVLLRIARESGDTSRKPEIFRRLQLAVRIAPGEAIARCQLGKALEWTDDWHEARAQMEACVRLDPDSPEGHYHLSRIYRRLGLTGSASRQTLLQKEAAHHQSEESVRRTKTVTQFLVLLER